MIKYLNKLLGITLLLMLTNAHTTIANEKNECVILLHGLARTDNSMSKLELHLIDHVVNVDYPSREKDIQTLAVESINEAINECEKVNPERIHFVTHSMGGILVRYYLGVNRMEKLGRVVMLSPPNRGSEVVDKLKDNIIFKWLNGPAGQQLGTNKESMPNKLGRPYYEVGIITGDKTVNPVLSLMIPGEDDGKVSVERAKLMGMKDFLVVHKSHTFIMNDEDIINQVIYFIENGIFKKIRD